MAGGSGARFWPASRARRPKQFLDIFGRKTLLEETVARIRGVVAPSRILIVVHEHHVGEIRRLVCLPRQNIIGEPAGRNTAPCAVLAAAFTVEKDPHATLAILPSDHRIGKVASFQSALRGAAAMAAESRLPVTFGVRPQFPHTGYGYLEMGRKFHAKRGVLFYRLKRFREKPSLARAVRYFRSRRFLWNSGIFVWRSDALLEAAVQYLTPAYRLAEEIASRHFRRAALRQFYAKMPAVSIDCGLMEKLGGEILTIPVAFEWSDLGSWHAFAELHPKDAHHNVVHGPGECLLVESRGNIVKTGRELVALLGMKDTLVVQTDDALLICPKEKSESIRKVVEELKNRKLTKYL